MSVCPKLIKRITKYLQKSASATIDVKEMASKLRDNYPDSYEGRKFHTFHQEVQNAFEEVMRMAGQPIPHKIIEEEPKPIPKKVAKPMESSDSEGEQPAKVENKSMNQKIMEREKKDDKVHVEVSKPKKELKREYAHSSEIIDIKMIAKLKPFAELLMSEKNRGSLQFLGHHRISLRDLETIGKKYDQLMLNFQFHEKKNIIVFRALLVKEPSKALFGVCLL